MERRATPLSDEAATVFWSPYVGLNIQANVPDWYGVIQTNHHQDGLTEVKPCRTTSHRRQ